MNEPVVPKPRLDPRDRVEREIIDFSVIPPAQAAIHARLEDWAQWCRGRKLQETAPGFSLHQSDHWEQREYGSVTRVPISGIDAVAVAKGVVMLPERHRHAVQWYYLHGGRRPIAKARELAMSVRSLRELLDAARQMLTNMGI